MKILFDLFPVILFFVTYKLFSHGDGGTNACLPDQAANLPWTQEPILLATSVAIAATFVQVAWVKYRHGKVDTMLWVSLAIITVFGGATLYFHNPIFIQWKPTILYWLFTTALVVTPLISGRNLVRSMMETQMKLPDHIWRNLNWSWALFFFVLGFANIAAIHLLSCSNWVNFKLFGITSLMFVFIIIQAALLSKYVEAEKHKNE
jgi:intracellular septation protein